jgi:hypothetical protein
MPLFKLIHKTNNFVNGLNKRGLEEIYSMEEFKRIIEKERARADRNNHTFSLVLFDLGSSDMKKTNIIPLIGEIKGRIRFVDETGWYDDQRIGMILPYTSNTGATKLAENICESLGSPIPKLMCTIYTYPLDKLNNKKINVIVSQKGKEK